MSWVEGTTGPRNGQQGVHARKTVPSVEVTCTSSPVSRITEGMETLRSLAEPWSQADVSRITGVSGPTVCRLWDDPGWLSHVNGANLRALAAGVAGVAAYFVHASLQERRTPVIKAAEDVGLVIDREVYGIVAEHLPEQLVVSAVETAVAIMRGDVKRATHLLATFWCLAEDAALVTAFAPPDRDGILPPGRGLFVDVAPLIAAAHETRDALMRRTGSFRAMLALSEIAHHLGRVSELEPLTGSGSRSVARHLALARRSEVMGRVVESNDIGLVDSYAVEIDSDPTLARVERWSMSAAVRDVAADQTLFVPARCSLANTAAIVLEHLDIYSDGYAYYLAEIAIPRVLGHDPTFGNRYRELRPTLAHRIDLIGDPATRKAVVSLLDRLPAGADHA